MFTAKPKKVGAIKENQSTEGEKIYISVQKLKTKKSQKQ